MIPLYKINLTFPPSTVSQPARKATISKRVRNKRKEGKNQIKPRMTRFYARYRVAMGRVLSLSVSCTGVKGYYG